MQVVGIMVAHRMRNGERGCSLKHAAGVISAFASLTGDELRAKAVEFVSVTSMRTGAGASVGELLEQYCYQELIDVMAIYLHVTEKAERLARRPANKRGRNRGLVRRRP
jgi:hypothetical protein